MLHDFELELDGLNTSITQDQQELDRISSESVNAEKFIALVKRYTDFSELTPAMINEFIEKILVHQAEGKGASRTQEIEIFFNFVGKVEIPHEEVELTEEEIAAIAEQERRRAKKAEYNRRYMQKKRKQWKEQQEQAQEPQEPIELPLVQDKKGALSAWEDWLTTATHPPRKSPLSGMAENKNAQQVREITDKLEQGIKELFESERFKDCLLYTSPSPRDA